jgi:TolB-like protein/Tfp pilus assembly protein PilF
VSLFAELKRRNVFRVSAAYAVVAWLLLQVGDTLAPALRLPDWTTPLLIFFLVLGFPLSLFLAWAYEVTPDGIKRECSVGEAKPKSSESGRQLDFAIIGLLTIALAYFVYDKYAEAPVFVTEDVTAATERKTIAVLPFLNLSTDPEQEFFSDGLSEELLHMLAKIPELRVTSRSSAFSYKGKDFKIIDVGRELGVDHVLEGSVRMSGDKIRITAQLIDVGDDSHIWSETWDRTLDDVFVIQDEIAQAVVSSLRIQLLGEAPHATKTSAKVFALYLQARHLRNARSEAGLIDSVELLQQAIDIDPEYAPVWVLLGEVHTLAVLSDLKPVDESFRLARIAAQEALRIDHNSGSAHALLGDISMNYDWDFASARRHLDTALALDPSDVSVLSSAGSLAWRTGRFEEALEFALQAKDLEPLAAPTFEGLASAYMRLGQFDEARAALEKIRTLSPDFIGINFHLCRYFLRIGDAEAALAYCDAEADEMFRATGLGLAYHSLGNHEKSNENVEFLIKYCTDFCSFQIAEVYAHRGDNDLAFEWLENAYSTRDGGLPLILGISEFDNLHDDPRFNELLQRVGLVD